MDEKVQVLMFEIAAFLKVFGQGIIPVDQAKREVGELLEKIGRMLE